MEETIHTVAETLLTSANLAGPFRFVVFRSKVTAHAVSTHGYSTAMIKARNLLHRGEPGLELLHMCVCALFVKFLRRSLLIAPGPTTCKYFGRPFGYVALYAVLVAHMRPDHVYGTVFGACRTIFIDPTTLCPVGWSSFFLPCRYERSLRERTWSQ